MREQSGASLSVLRVRPTESRYLHLFKVRETSAGSVGQSDLYEVKVRRIEKSGTRNSSKEWTVLRLVS